MKKFKIVEPVENGEFTGYSNLKNAIFLAGPCPRTDYSDDWRFSAFDILEEIGFAGTVITPTNPRYRDFEKASGMTHDEMRKLQVAWERTMMHMASAIVFWIPRDADHPALTTNVEFGEWYKTDNVFAGWPDSAEHNGYLGVKLGEQGKRRYATLRETLEAAVAALDRPSGSYFTSDTHFKQERTLELSRRPFRDVFEMDLVMISNWNKHVTMNDVVYHAGDFIDPDRASTFKSLLSSLNFKELHWVLGNYDRKIEDQIRDAVDDFVVKTGRVVSLHKSGELSVKGPSGREYVIVHEPNDMEYKASPGTVFLFGHIHGRSFAKRNGFDLASDYHRYTPISMEQVEWFANAMKYLDENVFSDRVNAKTV